MKNFLFNMALAMNGLFHPFIFKERYPRRENMIRSGRLSGRGGSGRQCIGSNEYFVSADAHDLLPFRGWLMIASSM